MRGYLSVPVEAGRRPAVVMLPSCEGRKLFHQSWARALSERGYVALVVDDYFMYDRDRTCGMTDPAARADLLQLRLRHALGAARYLIGHPAVDQTRIAVMGWGDAPVGALLEHDAGVDPQQAVFRAAVAVTPGRCFGGALSSLPLLVLRSESELAAPGESCNPRGDASVPELRVYEGTLPGFDDPQAVVDENLAPGASRTAPRRYHRLAHARAIEDVAAFLNRRLPPGSPDDAHGYTAGPTAAVSGAGTWALDPASPGPDLPPSGGSVFDAVFSRVTATGVNHHVPFPFPRLLQKLEHAAGALEMSRSPLDATLIPLGRSLQREAAAPDYFESPRIVVAVTGEPDSGTGPLGIRLKNRLFLGYQPRSQVIEIISYNEAAGRFEFQLVKNYGPDRDPSVRYARRALCTSCHQNAGPIFAEASWDETTANTRVVDRLNGLGAQFFGIPVAEDDRAASSIDAATDEANLLPVYQRIWSEGCSSALASEVARCRAGAFQAMVQYRLSNSAGFDQTAGLYANGYLPLQRRNWTERWPEGLLIPNPNLPDRSPLMSPLPSEVSAALDPLRFRAPIERWEASSTRDLNRLIRGLSRGLSNRHVQLLDQHLRGSGMAARERSLTARCEVIRRGFGGRGPLIEIECGKEADSDTGFHLRGRFRVAPDGNAEGEADWLEFDGGIYARRTLAGRVEHAIRGNRIVLQLVGEDGNAIRAPDGNTLLEFGLVWDEGVPDNATRFDASGTLVITGDFQSISSTLERLAITASKSSPLLSDRFDGAALADRLLEELGLRPTAPCCKTQPLPEPRLDADPVATDAVLSAALEHQGPIHTLRRYCGACHGGNSVFPPGFLHGEGEEMLGSVAQCAERIYFRLSMWGRRTEDQVVPPMPPVQGLSLAGSSAERWRQGEALQRLTAYARELLIQEGGQPDSVLEGNYHAARSCLSSRDKQRHAISR